MKKLNRILNNFYTLQSQLQDFIEANGKEVERKKAELINAENTQKRAEAILDNVKKFVDPEA